VVRWENSQRYLVKVADAMPEDKYGFKPAPEERTFAEQLMHVAVAVDWHAQTLIGGKGQKSRDYFLTKSKTKKEMIDIVNETFDEAWNVIKNFDPTHFGDTLNSIGLIRTKRQIFLLLSDHVTHHRAQMLVYMRLNGIVPPEYAKYQ